MADRPRRSAWEFVLCDSLEKVFPDQIPRPMNRDIEITAFADETVSVQLAFRPPVTHALHAVGGVRVTVDAGPLAASLSVVDLVPCTVVAFEDHDDGYLRDRAGLYPDLLRPWEDGEAVTPLLGQWRAVWICLRAPAGVRGDCPVIIRAHSERTGELLHAKALTVHATGIPLPALDIVNTHWLHCDSLAQYYGDQVFDERHWSSIESFVGRAVEMGANTVLTPVWTPPLDTARGGSRLPVQLVEITDEAGDYRFDFTRLLRWMALCERAGITHLEMPHLFTQWGAEYAPAIDVRTETGLERRFGWHTRATDPSYRRLLERLLPALRHVLDEQWGLNRVFFHISDEPNVSTRDSYGAARDVVCDLLAGCRVIDAISDVEFYAEGLVEHPVVALDALDTFLARGVSDFWAYYCVAQHTDVSNRFIGLPSTRNRVIGAQLFLSGASGFVHWGFNYYNRHLSDRPVNPFQDTCAGDALPAGDAFLVYPGDGRVPWESIRFRVFAEAMTDHRAMQLLRDLTDRRSVRDVVDPDGALTIRQFSADPDHYRRVRARVTREIEKRLAPSAPRTIPGRRSGTPPPGPGSAG